MPALGTLNSICLNLNLRNQNSYVMVYLEPNSKQRVELCSRVGCILALDKCKMIYLTVSTTLPMYTGSVW